MAVGRMLNKTAGLDPELNSVSIEAQLLFLMSIPHLDRDGLIIGEPLPHLGTAVPLRPELFPRYEELISELEGTGLVVRYQTKMGRVLFFPGFFKNQRITYDREGASSFDPPPGYVRTGDGLVQEGEATNSRVAHEQVASNPRVYHEQNVLKVSKGKTREETSKGKAREEGTAAASSDDQFDAFKDQYEKLLGLMPTAVYPDARDYMVKLIERGSSDWWLLALKETVDNANRPGWHYMKSVLESWIAAGAPASQRPQASGKTNGRSKQKAEKVSQDYDALKERYVPAKYADIIEH